MNDDSAETGESAAPNPIRVLHEDESAVAATEYIMVFSLITLGATLALIATNAYIKAYRDFTLWWFAHPAV